MIAMLGERNQAEGSSSVLPAGTMLRGRYRVERPLGQGGFGITYSAWDMTTRNHVAVKELFPSNSVQRGKDRSTVLVNCGQEASFAHMRKSFEQEAKTLIQLQNQEGIVRLLHLFSENETAYYVMELLEGEDMGHWLRRCGPISWEQLTPLLKTLLKALKRIHDVGLIHRDISPENIFLTSSGVRLIDFGSVRSYQGINHFTAYIKHCYAPWEQYLTEGHQGPWTDVYALCVTAYYSLSGKLPPPATERRMNDTVKPLETLCPWLPQDVCRAIHKGMAVQIGNRYQDMDQLYRALFHAPMQGAENHAGILCLRGIYAGRSWKLPSGSILRIGRNPECEIVYPPEFQGVSRLQCTFCRTAEGRLLVRDENSRFGTRFQAMGKIQTMEPRMWYGAEGLHIFFGKQEEYIIR